MYTSFTSLTPSLVFAGALVAVTGTTTLARAASSDEIPTQLRNEPADDDLNGPCSLCRVNSIKAAQQVTGDVLELELYFDDESGDMFGSIELTVLLYNGDLHTLTIEDVTLPVREITVFELEPEMGWDWNDDVLHVWVEPIPASPNS